MVVKYVPFHTYMHLKLLALVSLVLSLFTVPFGNTKYTITTCKLLKLHFTKHITGVLVVVVVAALSK